MKPAANGGSSMICDGVGSWNHLCCLGKTHPMSVAYSELRIAFELHGLMHFDGL